jgi:hypothetical protein
MAQTPNVTTGEVINTLAGTQGLNLISGDLTVAGTADVGALVIAGVPFSPSGVSTVSVVSANGFNGTVANPTTAPAITIRTTVSGIIKSNGTAIAAAVSGTDLKTVGGNTIIGAGDAGTIGATYGGTAQTTYTTGDTLYASAANTLSKLAVGTAGQILTVTGGIPAWVAPLALTSTQIAFGSTANLPTSNAELTYAPLTGAFKVNNTLSVALPSDVIIKGAAANTGLTEYGGSVNITGGYSDTYFGGDVNLTGGQGLTGGGVIITAGAGTTNGIIELNTVGLAITIAANGELKVNADAGTVGEVLTSGGPGVAPTWAAAGGAGTVTSVSVASANGFSGTVATATTTPAITVRTTITGILKGNGTAISAATSGTDYSLGTSALATGIVKSTTTTGALTIAVAGDFPTLNQNTSGTAAGLSATLATGSGGTGLSSVGTAGQVLTIVGGVPAWATSLTSGGFTYNPLTGAFLVNNTLSVAAPAAVTIKGAAVNTGVSADGGYVNIVGGYSDEASSFGGDVNITGGQGSYGGFVIITGGESIGADAGEVDITGGYGATGNDPGGDVRISGGDSLGGYGGDVVIKPGTGFIQDGVVDIQSTGGVSTNGNISITAAGKGLKVKDGANATFGTGAVLVGGTLVVSTTAAITASAIFLQVSTTGGTQGHLSYTISNATSFTVTSTSGTDTSTFNWLIIDPA